MFAAAPHAGAVIPTTKTSVGSIALAMPSMARPDAGTLLLQATELWHMKQDYTGALAKFNAAVEVDPNDNDVLLQRARFFELLSVIVVPDDKRKFEDRAHDDYARIAASDPDSIIAGIARDGLTRLAGNSLIEGKSVNCPTASMEAEDRADALYGAHRFAEAAEEYEKAAAGCPDDAALLVDLADSYYLLKEYEKAKALFDGALSIDPWNRAGHRFLADTDFQLQDGEAAIQQLVLAVVSDPVYEAGWSALKTYATAMGRTWRRVYGDKTAVVSGSEANADGFFWHAYRTAKADARKAAPRPASALAVERQAVVATLKAGRAADAAASKEPGPFWSMMARADEAGFLDEAIFLHMLDAPLAAEYPAYRDKNAGRLFRYLDTVVVPAP
jgi:tetratricopeptide (TPR) repeat protein